MQLHWVKSTSGVWLGLRTVNLSSVSTEGVYIIWHGGQSPRVVRVGQGDIATRLTAHRADQAVLHYEQQGTLFVTWADVGVLARDGVERYLAERHRPLVGDRFPQAVPIAVNDPW